MDEPTKADPEDSQEALEGTVIPIRERTVAFYGDQVLAAQAGDETIYVPLRPICEALGLNWSGQRQRAQRDPVLAESLSECIIHSVQGPRPMLALPLEVLPGWLFGISANKVRPELREKILRYQRECFRVLWNAFKADVLPAVPAPPSTDLSGAALALEIATAVQHLARQQLDMEQRQTALEQRQRQADYRLTALELQLSAGATISEDQAAEIALAVKNVGQALAARGDRNGYARVYSEMYRRYRISSYKNLPAARCQDVLAWLAGWYGELTPDA